MNRKQTLITGGRQLHRLLVWPALLALLFLCYPVYAYSGDLDRAANGYQ